MSIQNLISPVDRPSEDGFTSRLFEVLEGLLNGQSRNTVEVTLTANAASTTVDTPAFQSQQIPVPVPLTANAASELGAGTMYVSARTTGQFTITHANNAQTDRDFGFIFVG